MRWQDWPNKYVYIFNTNNFRLAPNENPHAIKYIPEIDHFWGERATSVRCKCDKIFNFDIYDGNNNVILLRAMLPVCAPETKSDITLLLYVIL